AEDKAGPIFKLSIQGLPVRKVLVTQAVDIGSETYAAILVDRAIKQPILMISAAGGVDIEDTAHTNPDAIKKIPIDPTLGLMPYQARAAVVGLGMSGKQALAMADLLVKLWWVFRDNDASLAEINPLVVTQQGDVLALDAKVSIDDSALFRHPDLEAMRDSADETAGSILARERGLSYVPLDGDIGCVVNGAGLAMATMDMIKLAGGEPANFLDIGGGASPERVLKAFRTVLMDDSVKVVLVNIFAGINRCDWVAKGVVQAVKEVGVGVPLVVRLSGTNVEEGQEIIKASGLPIISADSLADAAEKVVAAWKNAKGN
ncbi:MAG: ADP-forming succinate--CoA ligase subunit beta, partial [Acidobacteriota bacterium]|nr:ADP-forming succinate--CoA ligase subunit beta [Acidobacteriota bacterium]